MVYRFKLNVAYDVALEGERGVERLLDRLREYGYAREVSRRRTLDAQGKLWSTIEYGIEVDDPRWLEEAWPYEFSDAQQSDDCLILGVRLSRRDAVAAFDAR